MKKYLRTCQLPLGLVLIIITACNNGGIANKSLHTSISTASNEKVATNKIFNCQTQTINSLANSVKLEKMFCTNNGNTRSFVAHVLHIIDINQVDIINIGLSNKNDKNLLPLTEIASKSKISSKIIAGINGGYFNMTTRGYKDEMCKEKTYKDYGAGNSYLFINKEDWSKNCTTRPVMAYSPGVVPMLVSKLNKDMSLSGFKDVITSAGGGGPTLLINGQIKIDNGEYPWLTRIAPRTAIGTKGVEGTNKGMATLVVIDQGITINELANFMKYELLQDNAMNLDGGGSTTMCAEKNCSKVINTPKGGLPRRIHDGVFIIKR